ncbi:uncharacterized protein LOC126795324 [Argentina anserina]|uniref:uncharacterized protein LOC126795324 n=1 Tax=Argentina anserina TaxID=57926 RepID=UPI0021762792|nr:uncharacterized protein LOC126795324 [Potentilla anserina]
MGWQQKAMNLLKQPFQILTITLLSLLLPLSFLLLSRLSCANYYYLLTLSAISSPPPPQPLESSTYFCDFCSSLLLYSTPFLLYILVSVVSIAALIHGLTGRVTIIAEPPCPIFRPRLYTAWIFLCTLQMCVGLGIEESIATGIDGSSLSSLDKCNLLSRVVFFLGLHETMLHWCRVVVKPVVDDTVFGGAREERWVERGVMAASVGWLWWWRLRDEIESLVVVTMAKKELSMNIGIADFIGWWLYYVTVTIGMVRVVKGFMWLAMIFLCRRRRGGNNITHSSGDPQDKV